MYKIVTALFVLLLINACTSYSKLDSVMQLVKKEYVTDINQTKLTDDSIHHLLENLDPHTMYLKREDLEKFLIATTGQFAGVGISLSIQNKLLTIVSPIANSPAKKAGIQSGDVIIKIDEHPILGMNLEECIALTKGAVNTNLKLTILRKTTQHPLLFTLKRSYINANPLFATLLDDSILYISIPSFNKKTSLELKQILQKYTHREGIILDLRYNPGGILQQATEVIDMFINKGLILSQKGRLPKYTASYYATPSHSDTSTPLAILINAGSASASEIVSGALKVHKRATIIGEKSFGKGSVQTLFSLDNDSALKMTIAKYYLPNGKCIDGIGIKPDIIVKNKLHTIKRKKNISYTKAKRTLKQLLAGHISAKYMKSSSPSKTTAKKNGFTPKQIQRDRQLRKAIQVLKNSN